MVAIVSDFLDWIDRVWGKQGAIQGAVQTMPAFVSIESLESYWKLLPPDVQEEPAVKALYLQRKLDLAGIHAGIENPLKPVILGFLNDWKAAVAKYDLDDPTKADEKLASLAADVLALSAAAGTVELALGAFPNDMGTVASMKVSQAMGWLGVGAVVTAVAHDPVKIGLLRPYQDSLEAHFRNRRPGDQALFTAYQQRSLSATKITDVNLITDAQMTQIEGENEAYYDREISKWGFSEYFSNALKDASTKTLSFGNLMALAKQGRLNRGMAIYSLWGYGLDRKLMTTALDALDQANEVANYEGFRAQIEPAYIEGSIDEASLLDYWRKLHIPQDVQNLMLPRFRKKREAYALKQTQGAPGKERDLTVSQIQQAYQNLLMDRAHAQNQILTLGYSLDETRILLDLAEMRRKLPSAQTLKRLPLTDYEKAHKNGLISQDAVLARMQGEYAPEDIALEKALLEVGKA